jgi:hypothetical protein
VLCESFACSDYSGEKTKEEITMYERFGPKYVVQWQTEFDSSSMSPQEAALEALRELKTNNPLHMHVIDCETNRQWDIGFRDHVLEVIEVRVQNWDRQLGKMVTEPIKKWDEVLQGFVPVSDE